MSSVIDLNHADAAMVSNDLVMLPIAWTPVSPSTTQKAKGRVSPCCPEIHLGSSGSNENTNGLLRQYFPRGSDLSTHSRADLASVARQLNTRPRQTLDWMKPSEVFSRAVASNG
jgi:hypothetical protein